jgi:intracellular multiplication protein IcmJ
MGSELEPLLFPSVKRSTFRVHDPEAEAANAEYVSNRRKALEKARYTCQYCGFITKPNRRKPEYSLEMSGFLEVHHIDDDHDNNELENLAAACPFCHQVFHAGFAGSRQAVRVIWMPHISQANLNLLMNFTLSAIQGGSIYKDKALSLYETLSKETQGLTRVFGDEILKPENLSQILIHMDKHGVYEKRKALLSGLRFLPEKAVFERYLQWWSESVWVSDSMWEGIASERGV